MPTLFADAATVSCLVVEDDPEDFYIVERLLSGSPETRYVPVHIGSIEEARTALADGSFDVALFDYHIGGRLSTEILADMKMDRPVPFVMLTGRDLTRSDRETIHGGAFDFLDKNELTRAALIRSIDFAINRFRIEGRLRESEERLRRMEEEAEELRLARRRAEEANRVKSDFLARMSHELRTPLNAVLGYSEIIRDDLFGDALGERYRDYAGIVHSSGSHLLDLIDDLLDLSKIEAGGMKLNVKPLDPGPVLRSVCALTMPMAAERRVELVCDAPASVDRIDADERALKQMLVNLVSNAVKFSHEGADVAIQLYERENETCISVTDTGLGIDADQMEAALDPFGQTDAAAEIDAKGTGLGLPITKLLAEQHGGSLDLESAPGKGTRITLRFPMVDREGQGAADRAGPRRRQERVAFA